MEKILQNYNVKSFTIINDSHCTKNPINNQLNCIYVINLKKDKIRRNYILRIMKKMQLNFTLVVVEKITEETYLLLNIDDSLSKEEVGCSLSHMWCLKDVISKGHSHCIIFEDDIIFHKNFTNLFLDLDIVNTKYDFLLLGACDFSFSKVNFNNVKDKLYVPDKNAERVYGAHANLYSAEGAKKMFEAKMHNFSFFDKDYHSMFDFFPDTSFICSPNLVVTDISTTNLQHEYPFFSKAEENYYNKCFVNFSFQDYHFIYLDILLKNPHIKIEPYDTYQSYIDKILYRHFYNEEKSTNMKKRLQFDFFTIQDLKKIISTNNV